MRKNINHSKVETTSEDKEFVELIRANGKLRKMLESELKERLQEETQTQKFINNNKQISNATDVRLFYTPPSIHQRI